MHSLFVSAYEFTARLFLIPHEEVEMLMPRLFLGSPKRRWRPSVQGGFGV